MMRLLAILATAGAALALTAAPAAATGPSDPFSTNCDEIASLAGQTPAAALLALAGLIGGTSSDPALVKIQPFPPVTFVTTSNGGCQIVVNP